MKRKLRAAAAALAAAMAMSCMGVGCSAYQDFLDSHDGLMYRVSFVSDQSCVTSEELFTGWARGSGGNRYYYKDGVRLKNTWLVVNGERTYYLDSKGRMAKSGTVTRGGKTYTFDRNGRLVGDDVSAWGITASVTSVTRESVRLEIKRDKSADANEVTWGEEFYVEKLGKDGKWTGMESLFDWIPAIDDVLSYVEAGDKAYRTVFFAYRYGSLENGKYRVVKQLEHKEAGDKYPRTKRLYVEFNINDSTHHASCPTPKLLVNDGIITAETFTSSWDCVYPDGEAIGMECDTMHPLEEECREFMPVIKAKSGDKIRLSFVTAPDRAPALGRLPEKPDSFTVGRWTYDDWGNTGAKTESVEVKQLTFSAEKGNYIYYINAKWDEQDISGQRGGDNDYGYTAGTVAYAFCVEAD